MKTIIVTGATSMLGASLLNRLLLNEDIKTIYAVVRSENQQNNGYNKRDRIPKDSRIHIIECDMNDYERLPNLINEQCDIFYHFAWPRTATYDESYNDVLLKISAVSCTTKAVEAAIELGCKKFVGAGSQAEYGIHNKGYYSLSTKCEPVRVDGITHLMAGQLAGIIAKNGGICCIWMRIFSVYGPNDRDNSMISSTIDKLIKGEHCSFTKSEQLWDYLYSDDIAEAFYLVGKKVDKSTVYNVAYGKSYPLRDYLDIIKQIVSPNSILGIGELEYPDNAIMNMVVDNSQLVSDTGWIPKVDFHEGIRRIYYDRIKRKD